jgi:hypothetical protein
MNRRVTEEWRLFQEKNITNIYPTLFVTDHHDVHPMPRAGIELPYFKWGVDLTSLVSQTFNVVIRGRVCDDFSHKS